MGLGGKTITTWEEMKTTFLDKYQDYCKSRDVKEEIFKIVQKEDENMEDFLERFNYSLQRSGHNDLDKDILKIIFLRALREDSLELLNMVGKGDISKSDFDTICELCIQCSRGAARQRQGTRITKPSDSGVTKIELGNLLEDLRTDILNTLTSQMDLLQEKQKQIESEKSMAVFCPRCRKKHSQHECPLNTICAICEQNHETSECPSLPGLKVIFQGADKEKDQLYFMGPKKPWQP
jgi:hypothetical protein